MRITIDFDTSIHCFNMIDLNNMKKSDFYYELPQELIAQTPVEPRNSSRMLKVDRKTGECVHDHFYNLCNYLKKGDLLVLNDSRVLPARIYGERMDTHSFIEFLPCPSLLFPCQWHCPVQTKTAQPKPGQWRL